MLLYVMFIWFIFIRFFLDWNEEKIIIFCFLSAIFFIICTFGNIIKESFSNRINFIQAKVNVLYNIQLILLHRCLKQITQYLYFYKFFVLEVSRFMLLFFQRYLSMNSFNLVKFNHFIKLEALSYFLLNYKLNVLLTIFLNASLINNKACFFFIKIKARNLLKSVSSINNIDKPL